MDIYFIYICDGICDVVMLFGFFLRGWCCNVCGKIDIFLVCSRGGCVWDWYCGGGWLDRLFCKIIDCNWCKD